MNGIYAEELDQFCSQVDLSLLSNKAIMITGAAGLIGSYLVDILMRSNITQRSCIMIYAVVRNKEKAKQRFCDYIGNPFFHIVEQDISLPINFQFHTDYIIHAASNANPRAFEEDPIGTIQANVSGTLNLFAYAKKCSVQKLLYLSSSEIYGEPLSLGTAYDENSMGMVNPLNPRACYTESKRMAENICVNYSKQFGVPNCIARICFTYGPTFSDNDNRVIPQFLRYALDNRDIVLKSTGTLIRSYAYLYDVVSGLITILRKGKTGEAYNIANRNSNVSIQKIAETIAKLTNVNLKYELPDHDESKGYAPFSEAILDAGKLEALGWLPHYNISDGIKSTINALKATGEYKRLSVIVPVYNVRKYIEKCLRSLKQQDMYGIEYILVDDGSTDGSGEICDQCSSPKHRFKVIHKKNGGLMSAWMAGLKAASGEYIGFVDSDDYVDVAMFRKLYNVAKEKQADIVMCNHSYVTEKKELPNKPIIEEGWYTGDRLKFIKTKIFPAIHQGYISPSKGNKIFRKELLADNIKFCDLSISSGDDVNITVPCMLACRSFYYLNEPLYYYVNRIGSTSHLYRADLLVTYKTLLNKLNEAAMFYGITLPAACWENTVSLYGFLWVRAVWNSSLSMKEKRRQIYRLRNEKIFYHAANFIKKQRKKDPWVRAYTKIVLKKQVWEFAALLLLQKAIHRMKYLVGSRK